MKAISKRATAILRRLIGPCRKPGDSRKIDSGRGYLPACVEIVGPQRVSVAHYVIQNGDMCADPDIVFREGPDGRFYPVQVTQHLVGVFAEYEYPGCYSQPDPPGQVGLCDLAEILLANIADQQGEAIDSTPPDSDDPAEPPPAPPAPEPQPAPAPCACSHEPPKGKAPSPKGKGKAKPAKPATSAAPKPAKPAPTVDLSEAFGREPTPAERARAECKDAGCLGHRMCGICPTHGTPRLVCGCRIARPGYAPPHPEIGGLPAPVPRAAPTPAPEAAPAPPAPVVPPAAAKGQAGPGKGRKPRPARPARGRRSDPDLMISATTESAPPARAKGPTGRLGTGFAEPEGVGSLSL